ncbi:MAG: cyclic nucleotide-binding domain-containing protein [Polyangiales bacterium]|nr:cyclic nucleotide-binding domain-containing protein [Myxococcales bacterium]
MRFSREPPATISARTLGDRADAAYQGGEHLEALRLYAALTEALPTRLHARQRVGDVLVRMGDFQRAAEVYMNLARHAAHVGYPLRAVVAIKSLAALEPSLEQLLDDVAAAYGRGSARLGAGVRTTQPGLDQAIDAAVEARWATKEDALGEATAAASTYRAEDWAMPERLIPIPLLSMLEPKEFASALHAVRVVQKRAGEAVLTQGEAGASFFVLAHGSVRVSSGGGTGSDAAEKELARLSEGSIFGEMALLSDAPRTATVTALEDCDLLEFDRDRLAAASANISSLGEAVAAFARERLLNNVVRTSGIFQALDFEQQRSLVKYFTTVEVPAGHVVIRQGEASEGLYVVLRGTMLVSRVDGGTTTELARLGVGEMLGEIAIVNRSLTTATVRAAEPSAVLFLERGYAERLMAGVPAVRDHMERVSSERIHHTFTSIPPASRDIAEDDAEIFI